MMLLTITVVFKSEWLIVEIFYMTAAQFAASFIVTWFCERGECEARINQMCHSTNKWSWLTLLKDTVQLKYLILKHAQHMLSDKKL